MSDASNMDAPSGSDIVLQAKALLPHRSPREQAQALVALIPYVGGAVSAYWAGKDLERVVERIEQFVGETSARIRRLEAHDNLDKGFLETEEAAEFVIEVTNTVTLERDSEKRNLYATILANTARRDINRSFYPTALKLLDALAPIHIELLRELLRRREKHEKGGGEHNTSTRELAIKLHLQDLEQLRLAGLSDEIPHVFSEKPDGVRGWDAALGAADNIGGPGAEALKDKFRQWDDDILAHLQYMGKEGLVEQVSERRSSITQLSVRLLEWLSEPEG